MTNGQIEQTIVLWRIILVFIGSTIAALGWTLKMSVFLLFIGLPVYSSSGRL